LKCGRNAHFSLTELKRRLKMESKTPRTDAEFKLEAFFDGSGIVETVLVEFARQLETELAEAQELIKKLRRCANCKHKVEYVRFGEVATACALDVNEEEKQTCKNFDKWEAE
jgi:DNA-binding transcriptional MerR regulator